MSAQRWLVLASGLGIAAGFSCGDDVVQCPTGSCTLPGSTVVKVLYNSYAMDRGFPNDTCIDVGAFNMHADIVNMADATIMDSKDVQCGEGQFTFVGLPLGVYQVAVTPLDADGNSLVKAPVTGMVAAADEGGRVEVTVNVPYDAWTMAYMGNFLFSVTWGAGATCTAATPKAIATQKLTLTVGSTVITKLTDSGQKVDGTDSKPCHASGPGLFEHVDGLPFGPATLRVQGTDSLGATREKTFDTFVGVGANNPTLVFDVAAPTPDAGVDAMVDAPHDAPVDAAPDGP